ncbi:MAG: ATP-binding protein [Burkholderiales bacterium]
MAETRPRSIRAQLLFGVLAAVAATWIVTAVTSYLDARHELDELLDAHLAQTAALLIARTGGESDEVEVEHSPQLHPYERRVAFQFWEGGRTLRLHSANAPNDRPLSATLEGFSDAEAGGRRWRVFGSWDEERRFLVQVGEQARARDEIVAKIAKNLSWPLLLALPALGVLVWFGIARALRPLQRIGHEVEDRAADNLSPLPAGPVPTEAAPLVEAINRLLARLAATLDRERRFTADAAHELRTPLAAVRAQAQVAQRAADGGERTRALDHVIEGSDRAAHLVEQLLTLARLEPGAAQAAPGDCDLAEVARLAVADILPAADAKGVEVEVAGDAVPVRGDARLLRLLMRNLLDNAVRYGHAGTTVRVAVARSDAGVRLTVADDGPGVPADELPRLGERFHRVLGTGESGSGLGLSIVGRIADVHGATLAFAPSERERGLTVTVEFPPVR